MHEPDDGEQTASWLLRAGPGGLDKAGHKLNDGSSAAFGDFDGDGTRDVAVGDNGSRNNEPGYETEPPSVHHTVTVYYGNGRTWNFTGTAGTMAAGDFDGDARDDLAFGGGHEYGPRQPVLVFRGAPRRPAPRRRTRRREPGLAADRGRLRRRRGRRARPLPRSGQREDHRDGRDEGPVPLRRAARWRPLSWRNPAAGSAGGRSVAGPPGRAGGVRRPAGR
ncbi:FG-GAP repeat domain-containing protein [Nonomuraea ferruginea]